MQMHMYIYVWILYMCAHCTRYLFFFLLSSSIYHSKNCDSSLFPSISAFPKLNKAEAAKKKLQEELVEEQTVLLRCSNVFRFFLVICITRIYVYIYICTYIFSTYKAMKDNEYPEYSLSSRSGESWYYWGPKRAGSSRLTVFSNILEER